MKRTAIRLFSVLMACLVLLSLSVPSFALNTTTDDDDVPGALDAYLKLTNPVYVWWSLYHDFMESHPGATDKDYDGYNPGGILGECETAEEFKVKYDKYVASLPAQGYTSEDTMIWYVTADDVYAFKSVGSSSSTQIPRADWQMNGSCISYGYANRNYRSSNLFVSFGIDVKFPYDGDYRLHPGLAYIYTYSCDERNFHGTDYYKKGELVHHEANTWGSVSGPRTQAYYNGGVVVTVRSFDLDMYLPAFEVTFDKSVPVSKDSYAEDTRPAFVPSASPSDIFNYGIIGDNNKVTKIEDNSSIVNETTNNYHNPVTGTDKPIQNWTYDYSQRSYTLNFEGGDTTTVTYGDENITINENTVNNNGDTITNNYTIYYVVNNNGTDPDKPAPHVHDFQVSGSTPATCTQSGQTSYTCSCGETKSDVLPALGHDWQIKQSVKTEYDETGALVQEGYTIYECTRCKEQYKAASGASPPTTPGIGGSGGIFTGIFGLLMDFLSFFWNTFKDFTTSGVKAFLSALADGTSDIFGLLNPFDWSA